MVTTVDEALENFKKELLNRKDRLMWKGSAALEFVVASREVAAMAAVLGLTSRQLSKIKKDLGILSQKDMLVKRK